MNGTPADRGAPGRLPFSGLGFDLAPVRHRAARLRLRSLRPDERPRVYQRPPVPARPSGYGLQILLGREIRGR